MLQMMSSLTNKGGRIICFELRKRGGRTPDDDGDDGGGLEAKGCEREPGMKLVKTHMFETLS